MTAVVVVWVTIEAAFITTLALAHTQTLVHGRRGAL